MRKALQFTHNFPTATSSIIVSESVSPNITSEHSNPRLTTHSDSESDDEDNKLPKHLEYKCLDIQKMSDDEKSFFCGQLTADYRNITSKFSRLNCKIRKSLTSRNITPQQLADVLMEVSAFSLLNTKKGEKLALFDDRLNEIEAADNVQAVFKIIRPYGSFFDCHILKHIVKSEVCVENDRALLKEYLSELMEYCQRSIFKCPHYLNQGNNQKFRSLVMKVDDSMLTRYTMKALGAFRNDLAAVLKLEGHTLPVCSVETGCLLLVLQIPISVEGHVFPLSCRQKLELKCKGIKFLKNGEGQMHFDANQEVSL